MLGGAPMMARCGFPLDEVEGWNEHVGVLYDVQDGVQD